MKLNRIELQEALAIVKPGLANKEFIEQTTSFAFMNGKVITYNDEISISHPVKGLEITGAVQAEELYRLLNKIKTEEIDFSLKENEIIMKAGKGRAGFILEKEIKLPLEDINVSLDWVDLPEGFISALDRCKDVCSTDMSRPKLTCVSVKPDGVIEGTDSYRIYHIEVGKINCEAFLLPAISAKKVVTINPDEIAQSDGWVHFRNKNKTVISCRIFEEQYVDTKAFINVEGTSLHFPSSLFSVLEKAEVFSKRDYTNEESVSLFLKERKLLLKAKSDYGWFEEEIPIHYKGKEFEFNVSPASLMAILKDVRKAVLNEKVLMFEGDGWKYVTVILLKN